jgi:hypothetical protein
VHQISDAFPTSALPGDLKRNLLTQARMIYNVRGALLARLMATVYTLIGRRNFPPQLALQVGARQLGLRPQAAPARTDRGLRDPQVRQYHRRQQQRGRRPGQSTQTRARWQREAEALFESAAPRTQAEAELEHLLRRADQVCMRLLREQTGRYSEGLRGFRSPRHVLDRPREREAMAGGGGPYRPLPTPPLTPAQAAAILTNAANQVERTARQASRSFSRPAQAAYLTALDHFCERYRALGAYLPVLSPRLRGRLQALAQRFCLAP